MAGALTRACCPDPLGPQGRVLDVFRVQTGDGKKVGAVLHAFARPMTAVCQDTPALRLSTCMPRERGRPSAARTPAHAVMCRLTAILPRCPSRSGRASRSRSWVSPTPPRAPRCPPFTALWPPWRRSASSRSRQGLRICLSLTLRVETDLRSVSFAARLGEAQRLWPLSFVLEVTSMSLSSLELVKCWALRRRSRGRADGLAFSAARPGGSVCVVPRVRRPQSQAAQNDVDSLELAAAEMAAAAAELVATEREIIRLRCARGRSVHARCMCLQNDFLLAAFVR
jgi:hypothetical protein